MKLIIIFLIPFVISWGFLDIFYQGDKRSLEKINIVKSKI
jgi:hypothetical protein